MYPITRTAWTVMSGAKRTCCVTRLHGKSRVKRELLINARGMVAIGETSAKRKTE